MRRGFALLGWLVAAGSLGMLATSGHAQDKIEKPILRYSAIDTEMLIPKDHPRFSKKAARMKGVVETPNGWMYESLNFRAKVPGGWIVQGEGGTMMFLPDKDHVWDGGSLK